MLPWLRAHSSGGDLPAPPEVAADGPCAPGARGGLHRPRDAREAGQELVEFALVLPLLLLLSLGIFEFGRAVFSYNTIANAAREGARYGIVNPAGDIEGEARKLTIGLTPADIHFSIDRGTPGGTVKVGIDYTFRPVVADIFGLLPGATITLQTRATMQREQ